MNIAFQFVRPTELPSVTRDYDTGSLFTNSDYSNCGDQAISAGARNEPAKLAALIGHDDFTSLLLRYTVGVRASKNNQRARNYHAKGTK